MHLHKELLESSVLKIDKGSNQGSRDGCYGVRIVPYVDSINDSLQRVSFIDLRKRECTRNSFGYQNPAPNNLGDFLQPFVLAARPINYVIRKYHSFNNARTGNPYGMAP